MNAWMNTALRPEERAELLLDELSLDEKMKQVVGMWSFPQVYDMDQVFENGIGSFSTLHLTQRQRVLRMLLRNTFQTMTICLQMLKIMLPTGLKKD